MTALLQIAIPFLIFMAGLIYYFAFYQVRDRKLAADYFLQVSGDSVKIDCTQRVLAEFTARTKQLKLVPFICIGFIALIDLLIWLSSDQESSRMLTFIVFITGLTGIGMLLGFFQVKVQLDRRKKAYDLSSKHELIFEVNSDTLRVPALLLMNPAFWRAVDKGLHEISVPLPDIERLEVWPQMGNSRPGFKIVPSGKSAEWGQGWLGGADLLQFGIGVRRDLFTPDEERKILSFLHQKLGDRLLVKVNL